MTQTKLQILSEYTPDHPGPFCTREKVPVELMYRNGRGEYSVGGYVGLKNEDLTTWDACGKYNSCVITHHPKDLMNAAEVPVARDFWINETQYGVYTSVFHSAEDAANYKERDGNELLMPLRTIHLREVIPGEVEEKFKEIRKLLDPFIKEAENYFPSNNSGDTSFLGELRQERLSQVDDIKVKDLFALYEYFVGPISEKS